MIRKIKFLISCVIFTIMAVGCGNKDITEDVQAEYVGGIVVVDLLNEDTYEENGKKMVKAVEEVLNASPNDFHMLKKGVDLLGVFSDAAMFEETFDNSECDYYYVGDIKDSKPHGYGVITTGYDVEEMSILYIGEFKNGKVDDCYGMKLENYIEGPAIQYEGKIAYLSRESDLWAVPADGKRKDTYNFDLLRWNYDVDYTSMGLSITNVARCVPYYVGEIKDGNYSGEGVLYYQTGIVCYEGEFKNGQFHGKGKLYTEEGKILKEGNFKNGELEEGEYYRENE